MDKGFQKWFLLHLSHAIKQIDKRQQDVYVENNTFEMRIQWLRLQRLTLNFVLDWFFSITCFVWLCTMIAIVYTFYHGYVWASNVPWAKMFCNIGKMCNSTDAACRVAKAVYEHNCSFDWLEKLII